MGNNEVDYLKVSDRKTAHCLAKKRFSTVLIIPIFCSEAAWA